MGFSKEALLKEVSYTAVLSSGPGGQHANKASTKVVLSWSLETSDIFSETAKIRLQKKLRKRITKTGILQLSSDHSRSQHKNKEIVTKRFLNIVAEGLKIPKKRKKTKPSRNQKLKRLESKKRQADKKIQRKNPLN